MKKLFVLLLLAGTAVGAFWLWTSPYYAMYRLNEAIHAGDLNTVEETADIDGLLTSMGDGLVDAGANEVGEALGEEGLGGVLGALGKGVVKSLGKAVVDAAVKEKADRVRRAIATRDFLRTDQDAYFVPHRDALKLMRPLSSPAGTARFALHGTCKNGREASLVLVFTDTPTGWKATSFEAQALSNMLSTCGEKPAQP